MKQKDQISPKLIHEFVRAHDRYARNNRKDWSLYKHTYMTKYWEYITGDDMPKRNRRLREVEIEVNRLWGVITAYLSALYPRASRVILGADPAGKGDPAKAELAVNRMLSSRKIHERVMTALRQAILYPGAGIKVGYHHGRGSALDRVWMRVIPIWEMLLDTEVSDVDDERFRGHLYYRPKHEVEEEYGIEDLAGTRRVDFLSASDSYSDDKKNRRRYETAQEDNNFVRVLEFCNLVDCYVDPNNPDIKYEGRLEIYILGQGKDSKEPVYVGPLPFARHNGDPMAHIVPLIFNYEPEFPLRGIAHTRRLMPQFKELNAYRSYMAMATRKDTRQYVTRKGTFNSDEMTLLTEGHDGLILEVDSGYERPLNDAIVPISNAAISSNIQSYVRDVELDIERVIGTSPASRGIVTKATAFEIETVQMYTESEFGLHAAIKDQWLSNLTELMLRALIGAMVDEGDSSGAYEAQAVDMAEVGARAQPDGAEPSDEPREEEKFGIVEIKALAEVAGIDVDSDDFRDLSSSITGKRILEDMNEQELQLLGSTLAGRKAELREAEGEREQQQVDMALARSTASMQEPLVDEDVVSSLGVEEEDDGFNVTQESLTLRDRTEIISVTVEDLDASFEISFVEGGRTPLSDAAMQQNLVALMQPYMALWTQATQGGPQGIIARNYMQVLADRFDLPKDLHPDELQAELDEQEQKAPAAPAQPQAAPGAAPPPGAPPEPPPEGQADPASILQQVAQLPPDQAIATLREMLPNQPEVAQVLDQIAQLPPDQQPAAIAQLVESLSANL